MSTRGKAKSQQITPEVPSETHEAEVSDREKEDAALSAWADRERAIYDLRKEVEQELLALLERFTPLGVYGSLWANGGYDGKRAGANVRPLVAGSVSEIPSKS